MTGLKLIMYMSNGRGYFHDLSTGNYAVRQLYGWRRLVGFLFDLFHPDGERWGNKCKRPR